jgi:glycine cleavage system aminomethyltransferase T
MASDAAATETTAASSSSKKTALYDWHVELGGDMVPFAGYVLPVLYKNKDSDESSGGGGVLHEHLWCRSEGKCSLFDVSHMGQVKSTSFFSFLGCFCHRPCNRFFFYLFVFSFVPIPLFCVLASPARTLLNLSLSTLTSLATSVGDSQKIRWHGADRVSFLERLVVGDLAGLAVGSGCLSLLTNRAGGILDDTVITNAGNHLHMVVNGATKVGDLAHFQRAMEESSSAEGGGEVCMEYLDDAVQLLALQGPGSAAAVARLLPSSFDVGKMAFMTGTDVALDGIEGCRITR